jgi:hypothetical protein
LKPLFILGRARRSASTLEAELKTFECSLGLSSDSSAECGDLVFWPASAEFERYSNEDHHPFKFWERHKQALESGVLSEIVVGEIGKSVFTASETGYVDRHNGQTYMYGVPEDDGHTTDEYYSDDDPYEGRLFWTAGVQHWFNDFDILEETPSFGRKLLITFGRPMRTRFLDSPIGQKLRSKLGRNNGVVLNGQGADVAAIAFRYDATPAELFGQLKRLLPPRLVEDFLILDIGRKYYIGNQSLNLFDQWAQQQDGRLCRTEAEFDIDDPDGTEMRV